MPILFDIGRIILASLFILGGIDKIIAPNPSIEAMSAVGLPVPTL
ncbi:MAG: DoxX family membrane protein [Pseudomonadota bacterium]